ncbi:MAG: hypothetical protein PF517_17460 [Salinivirgaceae bacterium]|nr:hypothetical protein [Salinivirgaceae bacterium]
MNYLAADEVSKKRIPFTPIHQKYHQAQPHTQKVKQYIVSIEMPMAIGKPGL